MPVSISATLRNPAQLVSYVLPSGQSATTARDLVVSVYAPDRPGTYPVIVYSHGHGGSGYAAGGAGLTAQALADLGYIVILPNHLDSIANYPSWLRSQFTVFSEAAGLHRVADMQFALSQAASLVSRLPPGYTADVASPVVAGHSNGAYTAAVLSGLTTGAATYDLQPDNPYGLTSVTDPRFQALILVSPQGRDTSWTRLETTAWDRMALPTLIITGTQDDEPLGGPGRWEGRLDPFRYGDQAGTVALVYRDAGHDDVGGSTQMVGLTASITSAIDRFIRAWVEGDTAARDTFFDPAGLLANDPLLFEAFSRAAAGTDGRGAAVGTAQADRIQGLDSDDWLMGLAGDDILEGGSGDDRLDGGSGHDLAIYGGQRAAYRIWSDGADWWVKGPDGLDRLTSVEGLRFADGEWSLQREVCFFSGTGSEAKLDPTAVGDVPLVHPALPFEPGGERLDSDWLF